MREQNFRFLFAIAYCDGTVFRHDEIGRTHRRNLQASQTKGNGLLQLRGKPFRGTGKRLGRPVRSPLRILATVYNGRNLPLAGLRRLAMRLRPDSMRQLRPRISFAVFHIFRAVSDFQRIIFNPSTSFAHSRSHSTPPVRPRPPSAATCCGGGRARADGGQSKSPV